MRCAARAVPRRRSSLIDSHLSRLPADAPPLARARLLLARVEALRSTETDTQPSLVSGEALELVGPEPTQLRARILAMHAQALIWDGRFDEARRQADEAIELADQLELPRLAADVSVTLTWLNQHLDLGEGSRAELKRIIAEAQARGDVLSEMRGYHALRRARVRLRRARRGAGQLPARPRAWPARSAVPGPSRASPAGCWAR